MSALAQAASLLACPTCRASFTLHQDPRRLVCQADHSVDVARQGYVNLLPPSGATGVGDTAAMLEARTRVHHDDVLGPVTTAVIAMARAVVDDPAVVLDVGAGTGHHLSSMLTAGVGTLGVALDVSTPAAKRAARVHTAVAAVVCDTWQGLPVQDDAADVLLNVFAPREPAEFARVLRPGGSVIVVTPTSDHLIELIEALGLLGVAPGKHEELDRRMTPHLRVGPSEVVDFPMALTPQDAHSLVMMGPNAWHKDPEPLRRSIADMFEGIERLPVSGSVRVSSYRR